MRLFLLMLLCVVITNELPAQGDTKNGVNTSVSPFFVNRNGKIGGRILLDRRGKVFLYAFISPTLAFEVCKNTSPGTFTATGDGGTGLYTYQWYRNSTKINLATNPTYTPGSITNTEGYYCAIASGSYGTINTTTTTVTINSAIPTITGTTPAVNCGPGHLNIGALSSSSTVRWYDSSIGGILLGTGTTFITPLINASTIYYAEAFNGCSSSATRTPVLASIIPQAKITATTQGTGPFITGTDVTLKSSGTDIDNQYWQGPKGFFSVDPNPVIHNITSGMDSTYTVTGNSLSKINLVTNGDFESGVTGFSSDYILHTDSLQLEGTYNVVTNSFSMHRRWSHCNNHTVSGTLQMVINGATKAGVNVWYETVNVAPYTDYQFTYWVQSVYPQNPSILQLYVNDIPAGPRYTASATPCEWIQFNYNWYSGSNTTAKLSLKNQNTEASGNDFALDDIFFQQVCKSTSSVVVKVQ